ncbi:hypothetical protein H1W00_09715 [Aeromicrobium sp. Marseille-Q0843]|uniref:Glycosyltransferase RgtA/B/C/D-like domain-containing protein n=1 Tax=Aeromicrobium phoceense TaxID=2754045 RepID=A0A838XJ04_9ACTN|nr:hypothetical protein [Aeromicrobium phoceense]MBA4608748.1 hypothetical protein [Aeromicrobium phoceense]
MRRFTTPAFVGAATGLVAAALILGPALLPGLQLNYDMVFVPELGFGERTLGVDGSVPRAVPNDLVVAALSTFLPGWLVQKLLLVTVFVAAGAGAGSLLPGRSAAVAGALVACWNPWVAERLAIGHWGYLLGYASLFWVVRTAGRLRRGESPTGALGVVMALAGLSGSTGAVLAVVTATAVLLAGSRWPRAWRAWGWAMAVSVLVAASWWFPFLRSQASSSADSAGVEAFAARGDTPWGMVGSVLTGGGIWNQASWFAERQSLLLSGVALLGVLVAVAVAWSNARVRSRPEYLGAAVAGLVGLVAAIVAGLPGGRELVSFVVLQLPGGGLVRDGQKFAALWMVAVSLAVGLSAARLGAAATRRGVSRWVAGGLAAATGLVAVVTLPGLAWAGGGRWSSVDLPVDFTFVAERLEQAEPGAVAVLPWTQYRRYDWNDDRVVLDPWPRLLERDVRVNDALPLRDGVVAGEDPRAAEVTRALAAPEGDVLAALRAAGVRHVLLQTDQPGPTLNALQLGGAELRIRTDALQWWDLGDEGLATVPGAEPIDHLGLVLGALGLALAAAGVVARAVKRRDPAA